MPKPNCMDIQAVTERLQLLSGETAGLLQHTQRFHRCQVDQSLVRRIRRVKHTQLHHAHRRSDHRRPPGQLLRRLSAAHIIKNQLTRAGNSACLVTGAGRSLPFFCTLQQTWRKNKSNFTDRQTPIGRVDKDFYLYIGPFDRNILELPEDAVLETGDRSYYFIKREAVCMGGQLLYYTGVMKRLQEGSYEVDNGSGDAGTGEAAG